MTLPPSSPHRWLRQLVLVWGGLGTAGCEQTNSYYVTAAMFDTTTVDSADGATPDVVDSGLDTGFDEPAPDSGDPEDTGDEGGETTTGPGDYELGNFEFTNLPAEIWSNLMVGDEEVHVTSLYGKRAVLFNVTRGFDHLPEPVLLLPNEPVPGFEVTDIASIRMGDRVVLAASDPEAVDIVMAVYALDGGQIIAPRTVVTRSRVPTNDMKLTLRDGMIHLVYGADGPEKQVMSFDSNLSVASGPDTIDDPSKGSQLGCIVPTDDGFTRIAGNLTNHGLVGVHFDANWNASEPDTFDLPIPADDDEWLWFSSGCAQDPKTGDWYVAHQHMRDGDNANEVSAIEVSKFGPDWTFHESVRVSDRMGYTRPQLVIRGDDLFLSFDRSANDVQVGRAALDPDR